MDMDKSLDVMFKLFWFESNILWCSALAVNVGLIGVLWAVAWWPRTAWVSISPEGVSKDCVMGMDMAATVKKPPLPPEATSSA